MGTRDKCFWGTINGLLRPRAEESVGASVWEPGARDSLSSSNGLHSSLVLDGPSWAVPSLASSQKKTICGQSPGSVVFMREVRLERLETTVQSAGPEGERGLDVHPGVDHN